MPSSSVEARPPAAETSEAEWVARWVEFARAGRRGELLVPVDGPAEPRVRERVARAAAAILANEDPAAARRLAESLPPGAPRAAVWEVMVRQQVDRDAPKAVEWALGLADAGDGATVRRVVAEESVARSGGAAVRNLARLSPGPARDEVLGYAVAAWARRDPGAARAWIEEVPEGEGRRRWAAAAGFEVAQREPVRALDFVELLPPGRDRWLLLTAIAQTWIAVDASAAFAWCRGLPPGEAREAAVAGLDAGLGIAVARRMVAPPEARGAGRGGGGGGGILEPVTGGLAGAFAAWLEGQPAGLDREAALLAFIRQRSSADALAVAQWIELLPGVSLREQARDAYWQTLVAVSPDEAARWLAGLPRAGRSDLQVERTAREWARRDPGAAAAWLRDQAWTEERIDGVIGREGRR
jgi:hypothetical protein